MAFWHRLFNNKSKHQDLQDEIKAHLAIETQQRIDRGELPQDARVNALRDFGNVGLVTAVTQDTWKWILLDQFSQDVRYVFRSFLKNPGLALTIVLTLGMGIGGNSAMFSLIRSVLLKPLPYKDADRLVHIGVSIPQQNAPERGFTQARLTSMSSAKSFINIAAALAVQEEVALSGNGDPVSLKSARVSANFLDVLGVPPALGRSFLAEEDVSGGRLVAMISTELWKSRFNGDPSIIGRTANLNTQPYTIIGVLPEGFSFPFPQTDVWMTRPTEWSGLQPRFWPITPLYGFARLKPGVNLEQVRAEMDTLNRQYLTDNPKATDAGDGRAIVLVRFLNEQVVANVRTMLWMLLGAVGLVLLIACANVASLLMARANARHREFAVRTAIGAGRGRLVRQLLTESLTLALAGGALGFGLSKAALIVLILIDVFRLPRAGEIQMDATVLGFTLLVSVATGISFGVFPALQIFRAELANTLRESAPVGGVRRGVIGVSTRSVLVVTQVALSMVLLIGAGLMLRTLAHLRSVNPGFDPDRLLTLKIPLPMNRYDTPDKRAAFFSDLAQRVEGIPNVRRATLVQFLPTTGALGTNIFIEGQPTSDPRGYLGLQVQSVMPNYFQTMRIPLRRGRDFTVRDNTPDAPPVVIINEKFARRFWPAYPNGQNPIGLHMTIAVLRKQAEIIGIVGDVQQQGLAFDSRPEFFYVPNVMYPPQTAYLAVRADGNPLRLVDAIRAQVQAIDPTQPISGIRMMDEIFEASIGQQRLAMLLLGMFAGAAVLLTVIGIYGVLAYSVAQRTREIGLRRALGAQRSAIMRTVVGHGFVLVAAGAVFGVGAALALTRVMTTLLFHVAPTDPTTFFLMPMLFVVIAVMASYLPARRAARVDPLIAIRGN
jgi:putative ABC transport system permease protein